MEPQNRVLGTRQKNARLLSDFSRARDNFCEAKVLEGHSLDHDFALFLRSKAMSTYFCLSTGLTTVLSLIYKEVDNTSELSACLESLASESRRGTTTKSKKEWTQNVLKPLEKIQKLLLNHTKQSGGVDGQIFQEVVNNEWNSQISTYVDQGREKAHTLDKIYVMENLFGFNLCGKMKEEAHEQRWIKTLQSHLEEEDHRHIQIVRGLESTQHELSQLYPFPVDFESLVKLTIWRHERDPQFKSSFADFLPHEDSLLAYGHFTRDYREHLMRLHHQGIPLQLAYIDFGATRTSQPILLDLKPLKNHSYHTNSSLSFSDLLNQRHLTLSCMGFPDEERQSGKKRVMHAGQEQDNARVYEDDDDDDLF